MALLRGDRFGAYEILTPLGSGGMGEVHRAHDTKLRRDVAIKVLPASLANDPDRLLRFEREAQVLASLNHPHIAGIHGVEEAHGTVGLILELVEGETLEERLARGPIALEDALPIANQMAGALEAAHERGIVHRDFKPSNVKITPEGVTKVLDFGLAKWSPIADVDPSRSPTMPAITRVGESFGTAAFMSPEQARGRATDKRVDIWAFGCVLYEMLTGCRAFAADNMAETIAAVLERDPAWQRLPNRTPPSIRRLLRRCLEKDPRRRLRDIGDARLEMDDALVEPPEAEVTRFAGRVSRDVQLQRLTDFAGLKEFPAISPDGKMVAFVSLVDGRRQIWIRLRAGGAPLQVTREDVHHEHPRWSPDSSALLYFTPSSSPGEPGTIWEVSAFGGRPRRVATALGGADMSHDGRRIALFRTAGDHMELAIISRDGGRTEGSIVLPGGHVDTLPRWSHDDRVIAWQRASSVAFDMSICAVTIQGGSIRDLAHGYWLRGLCWLPDDSGIVYSSSAGSSLLYPPTLNLRRVDIDGTGDRQLTFGDVSHVEPDAHTSGALAATLVKSHSDIWRFPTDGSARKNTRVATRITNQTGQVQVPSVSPDDRQIVYLSDNGGHGNLWVINTDGSDPRQITFEADPHVSVGAPFWAPSGNRIVFVVGRSGHVELWLVEPDGSGLRQVVSNGWYPCWSGDGQWLYYNATRAAQQIDKIHIDRSTVVQVRGDGHAPAIAADGSALYYVAALAQHASAWGDLEIRRAQPEDATSEVLVRIVSARVPIAPLTFVPSLSPDGKQLAVPLIDGSTTNLWVMSTSGGALHQATDFGDRAVLITRRVPWSGDSRFLYAAVAEVDHDVVLLDGLL
ncbi:MAG TPA: protein kinase [Vicinamibacterales bacterium]